MSDEPNKPDGNRARPKRGGNSVRTRIVFYMLAALSFAIVVSDLVLSAVDVGWAPHLWHDGPFVLLGALCVGLALRKPKAG
jgi:hypothetical protein